MVSSFRIDQCDTGESGTFGIPKGYEALKPITKADDSGMPFFMLDPSSEEFLKTLPRGITENICKLQVQVNQEKTEGLSDPENTEEQQAQAPRWITSYYIKKEAAPFLQKRVEETLLRDPQMPVLLTSDDYPVAEDKYKEMLANPPPLIDLNINSEWWKAPFKLFGLFPNPWGTISSAIEPETMALVRPVIEDNLDSEYFRRDTNKGTYWVLKTDEESLTKVVEGLRRIQSYLDYNGRNEEAQKVGGLAWGIDTYRQAILSNPPLTWGKVAVMAVVGGGSIFVLCYFGFGWGSALAHDHHAAYRQKHPLRGTSGYPRPTGIGKGFPPPEIRTYTVEEFFRMMREISGGPPPAALAGGGSSAGGAAEPSLVIGQAPGAAAPAEAPKPAPEAAPRGTAEAAPEAAPGAAAMESTPPRRIVPGGDKGRAMGVVENLPSPNPSLTKGGGTRLAPSVVPALGTTAVFVGLDAAVYGGYLSPEAAEKISIGAVGTYVALNPAALIPLAMATPAMVAGSKATTAAVGYIGNKFDVDAMKPGSFMYYTAPTVGAVAGGGAFLAAASPILVPGSAWFIEQGIIGVRLFAQSAVTAARTVWPVALADGPEPGPADLAAAGAFAGALIACMIISSDAEAEEVHTFKVDLEENAPTKFVKTVY